MSNQKDRVLTFDMMKGYGILLVIMGHSSLVMSAENTYGMLLNNVIYSFHMPMFFIISGYFYKEKDLIVSLKNDFHRLLVPYLLTSIICILAFVLVKSIASDYSYVPRFSITFLTGYAPVLWFLVALFISKNLFNFAVRYIEKPWGKMWFCIFILIVSLFGIMSQHLITLKLFGQSVVPFSIAQALSALLFMYVGRFWHQHGISNFLLCLFFICFVLSVLLESMSMFSGRYPYLIINVVGAIGGTYLLYKCSELLAYAPFLSRFLSWIGRISLLILCVHCLDFVFGSRVRVSNNMIQMIAMLIFPLIFSFLLSRLSLVRRIFRI